MSASPIGENYLPKPAAHDDIVSENCNKYGSRFLNSITSFIDFLLKIEKLNSKLATNLKFLNGHFKANKDITTMIDAA